MNKFLKSNEKIKQYFNEALSLGIDFQDSAGNNQLHLAVKEKNLERVQVITLWFLDNNKSLYEQNNLKETACDLAEFNHSLDIYFWLKNPDISLYKKIDHIGQFYKNLRAEGENTECICSIYDKDTKKDLIKLVYLHERYGGWRLLEYCFQKAGLDGGFSQVQLKTKGLFFYFINIVNLIRAIFVKVLKKYKWKLDKKLSNRKEIRIKYLEISEEHTAKFISTCKKRKELFYLSLIKICNDVLVENLLKEKERTEWLITMPNPYKEKNIPHNYNDFSFLPISIRPKDSSITLKNRVAKEYFLLSYLKVLWEIRLFNFLYRVFPKFIKSKMRNGETRFATFSFFGKKRYDKNVGLYGATNANCFSAVTIVTIIENNKLGLSMDIHPSFIQDIHIIDLITEKIKKQVENYE